MHFTILKYQSHANDNSIVLYYNDTVLARMITKIIL